MVVRLISWLEELGHTELQPELSGPRQVGSATWVGSATVLPLCSARNLRPAS